MKDTKKEVIKKPAVCCPYFDQDKRACSHPDCIRLLNLECEYSNRKNKK